MRNGFIIDTLTSVVLQGIVKIGSKVDEICEGVIYRKKFIMSHFRNVIDKLFASRQKYKGKIFEVMHFLVKLRMNSLEGENI